MNGHRIFFAAMSVACLLTTSGDAGALPPGFVDAETVVPGLQKDIRYAGRHNFTGTVVDGYDAPHCWLTREAASALATVQADLASRGFGLKVFDCYRPARAVRRFVAWTKTPDESTKRAFYPDVAKSDLLRLGYIAERSSHSRGSTVDLTLVDKATGRDLDMGTPFDFFGARSHPDAADVSDQVVARRKLLADVMRQHGFKPYDQEWWHFTLAHEPYPDTFFDVPVR